MKAASSEPGSTKSSKVRPSPRQIAWIAGGVVVALLAVFIAWHAGKYAGSSQQQRLETDLSRADARLNALEARRLIHRSILDLEARNFGTAQAHARKAAQFLTAVAEDVGTEDVGAGKAGTEQADGEQALQATLTALREFQARVDPDVGKQVAALLALAQSLDEQFPPPERPHGVDEQTEEQQASPTDGQPAAPETTTPGR